MSKRLIEKGRAKGQWWPVKDGNKMSASIKCPICGLKAYLTDHEIADDGSVVPSVDCPRCEFHDMVKLLGWEEYVRV